MQTLWFWTELIHTCPDDVSRVRIYHKAPLPCGGEVAQTRCLSAPAGMTHNQKDRTFIMMKGGSGEVEVLSPLAGVVCDLCR